VVVRDLDPGLTPLGLDPEVRPQVGEDPEHALGGEPPAGFLDRLDEQRLDRFPLLLEYRLPVALEQGAEASPELGRVVEDQCSQRLAVGA
jgi:hypothetical protein